MSPQAIGPSAGVVACGGSDGSSVFGVPGSDCVALLLESEAERLSVSRLAGAVGACASTSYGAPVGSRGTLYTPACLRLATSSKLRTLW